MIDLISSLAIGVLFAVVHAHIWYGGDDTGAGTGVSTKRQDAKGFHPATA